MGIMSPRRKESFSEEEEEAGGGENKKSCADCKTTKTPLWRGGPSGPKSLCNACGIRYRKRRSSTAPLKLSQGGAERKMRERQQQQHPVHNSQSQVNRKTSINDTEPGSGGGSVSSGSCSGCGRDVMSEPLNMRRLMIFGKELLVQTKYVKRQRCQRKRIKFGDEEEQAAFSLIALSCGAVFA